MNYHNPFYPLTKIKFAIPASLEGAVQKVILSSRSAKGGEVISFMNLKPKIASLEDSFAMTFFLLFGQPPFV